MLALASSVAEKNRKLNLLKEDYKNLRKDSSALLKQQSQILSTMGSSLSN